MSKPGVERIRSGTRYEGRTVRAVSGVEAIVGDDKTLDGPAGDEVLADDFRHVFDSDATVPDGFRVDDNGRAVFALVETSGFVGADRAGEAGSSDRVLQGGVEFAFAVGGAGGAGAAGFADIRADKDMRSNFANLGGSFCAGCWFKFYVRFCWLSCASFPPARDGVDWQFRLCFRTVCSPLKTIWWPLFRPWTAPHPRVCWRRSAHSAVGG